MTKIEELWSEASIHSNNHPIEPNGFRLVRINPESRFDIYAGLDAESSVMLAIGVLRHPPAIQLDSASLDYFRHQRQDGSWLMVLRLRLPALMAVFGRLCQDLADASAAVEDETALIRLFQDRLNLWQKLFRRGNDGLLSSFEIKGLLAELLILDQIIAAENRSVSEAVIGWIGPFGADQDFLYLDSAIEVKAIGPTAASVSISSMRQLDSAVPMQLRLVTLREAATDENDSINLNTQVQRIEAAISSYPDALSAFKDRLLEACYVENEYYDKTSFQALKFESFDVDESFPKITTRMVPEGIESANYTISLDAIRSLVEMVS